MNPWENEEFVREVYTQTKKRLEKEHQMNIIALFHVENHMEATWRMPVSFQTF